MMNNLYFENIVEVGNLYLEYVFLEFCKEPIFFTCVDEGEKMYICLCSEIRGEQRWIISKCDINVLQTLIDGDIDMSSIFELEKKIFGVKRNLEGIEESYIIQSENIDPLDLPKKGTFLKCNQMKAMNYLTNKKFATLSNSISTILEKSCRDVEDRIYSTVFKTESSLSLAIKNTSQNIIKEVSAGNHTVPINKYMTNKSMMYQGDSVKNDAEHIDDNYLFAA